MDLGLNVNEREFKIVLEIIAATEPHLEIVEDIEMYLSGLSNKLSDKTINLLMKQKNNIQKLLEELKDFENE